MTATLPPPTVTDERRDVPRHRPARPVGGRRRRSATRGWNALAVLLSAIFGFPIYWMLITSFKTSTDINQLVPQFWPHHPTLRAFREVLADPIFRADMRNSLVITLGAVLVSVVIGFFGALAIARFRFAGRRIFVVAVLLVQMIPLIALTIPLSLLLDNYQLKNSIPGIAIAYLVFTTPYTVWTLRTFIANIPRELDDAAMVDGCNRWQTFYKIILPLVAPGLIATGVYGWILAWNEFVLANTLLVDNDKQTAMIYLLVFQSSPTHGADYGGLMAAATLTALPVVVLFAVFQSRISTGLTAGAVKG
ncbi:MAG TPA: carbohydrate ABC transporter permease [Jatrophihabitans sp.]|nr:carbohydrate ABC transporter permease [Jatrophihabitans sp.]